jgi:uroporphyrin-3 C-methyltransferase
MNDTDKREQDALAAEADEEVKAEAEEADAELLPEEEQVEEQIEEQVVQPAPAAKKSGGSFLAFLALLLAGAALGASYYLWQQLEQVRSDGIALKDSLTQEVRGQSSELPGQISALQGELSELRAQVSPLQAEISTLGQELQQRPAQDAGITPGALDALQRQISELRDQISRQSSSPITGPVSGPTTAPAVSQTSRAAADSEAVWMVAEVEYLLLVANRRLQLEQDLPTALAALQMADKRLRESGDPAWMKVREQLAAELAALRSVPAVDRDGLSLQIASMVERVGAIEPLMMPAVEAEEEAATVTAREERSLETLPGDAWRGLKSLLIIRRHDGELPLFLPPDQLHFLKQNLQLQLEAARYALLRSDQRLYSDSLERAGAWLAAHFDPEQDEVKSLLVEIEQLKQVQIQPELPDLSGSLRALQAQVSQP